MLLITTGVRAQLRTCGTDDYMAQRLTENPKLITIKQAIQDHYLQTLNNGSIQSKKAVITIPTVVHVVYNTSAENISDAQVQSQIDVLNEDYRRLNADTSNTPSAFLSVAADSEIEFCLAQQDPSGNPTNGITRTSTSTTTFSMNDDIKITSNGGKDGWPRDSYLNIWVCDLGSTLLGYATPPGGTAWRDGVVIGYTYFGTTGTVTSPFNKGRTTTHEIGHWLNLDHPFNGGCVGTTSSDCASAGDYVCDTPPTSSENYFCPGTQNTCTETPTDQNDMTMNYMDYVDDGCMNLFTEGQKTRMVSTLNGSRWAIQSSVGCVTPAGNPEDAGVIAIITPTGSYCSTTIAPEITIQNFGTSTLTSVTINYDVDGGTNNTFSWTGSLANNATDNVTLPSISVSGGAHTFNSSTSNPNGSTDLDPSNDASAQSFTINGSSGTPLPFAEGFENTTFPPTGWTLDNPEANATWSRVTTASGSGNSTACAKMDFYSDGSSTAGQSDYLYTSTIDFSSGSSPTVMDFNVAYVRWGALNYDTLIVWATTDCGTTWTNIWQKSDSILATSADNQNAWTPSSTEWRAESINLDAYNGQSAVQFLFEGKSGWGNNLYLDDIDIYTSSGTPPVANFTANSTSICAGETVTFTDMSTNIPTSWSWTFNGGSPGSSTSQNLTVTYNNSGTYTVTLTATNSAGNDTKTSNSYITVIGDGTPMTVSAAGNNTSCFGSCDGVASANVTSGTAPYTYSWNTSPTQNSTSATGLCAGAYTVNVVDANGCTASNSTTISEPSAITLSTVSTDATCMVSDGSASVSITTGGTSPFTYLWSNGGTSSTETGLAAGIYDITVTDNNGCSSTQSVSVNNVGAPAINTTSQNVSCNGGNDGSAVVMATGGAPPYTYNWNTTIAQTTDTATGLAAGDYVIMVTDLAGCIASIFVTISEPSMLNTAMAMGIVSADTACDGTATTIPTGGTPPYSYLWDDPMSQTNATATGLCYGIYNVTITDNNACSINQSVLVDSVVTSVPNLEAIAYMVVYPNPTSGMVYFRFNFHTEQDVQVSVFDITGKIAHSEYINNLNLNEYAIDLSAYSRGIYFVTVQSEEVILTKKISLIK